MDPHLSGRLPHRQLRAHAFGHGVCERCRYWIETWAAGGIEAQRRAAWRNLVAAHGSGRAAWIIQKAKPAGSGPPKDRPEDVLLIITADAPQSPKVQEALGEYWKAVWLADGDKTKIDAAASTLAGTSGIAAPESLISQFAPANLATRPAPPHSKGEVRVDVAWLILQSPDSLKARSWSEPPSAQLMPDCFVVLGYQNGTLVFEAQGRPIPSPLIAGPDPSAPEADQMQFGTDGHLNVPEDMAWMTDFESAIEAGMGIKVPLDGERVDLSRPIDRVIALGLRLADDAESGSAHLEQLITNHRYARPGLAFVPQGTPTNNTDSDSAGFSRTDDADASYDALFDPKAEITPSSNWWRRQDGEWLADALGIDWHTLNRVPQSSNADFSEARAMNRALWPATLGYTMETMLNPIFDLSTIETTRWFYTHYVTGRGFLPCLRVGNQPYGVLPISALSRWTWPSAEAGASDGLLGYLRGLHSTLAAMRADWAVWAQASARIGKAGDAHQVLLDVLGVNATSVEYYQRYAESFDHLFNLAKFEGIAGQMLAATGLSLQQQAMLFLRRLGYTGAAEPDALQRFFFDAAQRLNGPLIDDRPLSERDPIRAYTDDGHNYIEWLINTARSSFDDLRLERGFSENKAPLALLYTMLRHALQLGYWDSALKLHQAAGLLSEEADLRARREPVAIHLTQASGASESRLAPLYNTDARITGANDVTVAQHITQSIAGEPTVQALNGQLSALTMLKGLPTARLERCLAEHIDTASYRLDAWLLGLVNFQLMSLRYGAPTSSPGSGTLSSVGGRSASSSKTQLPGDERRAAKRGIYLGAYGILENLQRAKAPLKQAELAELVAEEIFRHAALAERSIQWRLHLRAIAEPGDDGSDLAGGLPIQCVGAGAGCAGRQPLIAARAGRTRNDRRHP